ncbi:MAG: fibrobacter succinogenes major paralogous domain-containing protein [Tenuifilaceae bacterium]|nr:fibrobacter succinogenes major paralogous domain-containing protein [Tenuifilaceae bacterium]
MKAETKIIYYPIIFCIGVILTITVACEKEQEVILPSLSTIEVTDITITTATCGGNITDDGNGAITARGIVWATTANPTAEDNEGKTIEIPGTGKFTSEITGLIRNTIYYVRAYATNKAGIAYGNELEFTTEGEPAAITTTAITDITATSATGGGNITDDGGANITSRGIVWSTSENPTTESNDGITTDGEGTGSFESGITNLQPDTEYYVRAYSVSSLGTYFGEQINFTTYDGTISISTNDVTGITLNSAQSGGNITFDGGAAITARGVVWSTSENPTTDDTHIASGDGVGEFTVSMTGLTDGTTYYIRAYATNLFGITYGNELRFTTFFVDGPGDGVTDIEGNTYATVKIGNQEWIAENLKTTKYRNGDPILTELSDLEWNTTNVGAYAIYPHSLQTEAEVLEAYGALYNWYAVDDSRGLCPGGWHVPTDEEWTTLTDYAGGNSVAGGKLKSIRTEPDAHPRWNWVNEGATDEYGFSALPGGYRANNGSYYYSGHIGECWSSSVNSFSQAVRRSFYHELIGVYGGEIGKIFGLSVRCIKDTE